MDKQQLKDFSVYSRNKLRQDVYSQLKSMGIDSKGIQSIKQIGIDLIEFEESNFRLEGKEVAKYKKLVQTLKTTIENKEFSVVLDDFVEEVAYTWFNRIIAIRFMEVNGYLPHGIRVLSSTNINSNDPDILSNYQYADFDFSAEELGQLDELSLKRDVVSQNKLFQILFLKQSHELNKILPDLFEKTEDYKDLLLNISFTDPKSVVYKLVNEVDQNAFDINSKDGTGQIEVIGWLYQYYNSEKRDNVISVIKKSAIRKEDIPAATQLFTPQWIVKYMVDNSLGRYWVERNPNSPLKDKLEYLVKHNLEYVDDPISPEDIKVLDNAMGSGHILVYAFDVLMEIYISEGYQAREAAKLILEKNIYGLDIDKRAYQLAYFALAMKVRQYNRKAFDTDINNNIYYFKDSPEFNIDLLDYFGKRLVESDRKKAKQDIIDLLSLFKSATELGSIMVIPEMNIELARSYVLELNKVAKSLETMELEKIQNELMHMVEVSEVLLNKYHVVVTNPPYMNKFKSSLKKYINFNYNEFKHDLFSVFIHRNITLLNSQGYSANMTPMVWMFIGSYEKMRKYIIDNINISSLIQLEYSSYDDATVPLCSFVIKNTNSVKDGVYFKLTEFTGGMEVQNRKFKEALISDESSYTYLNNQLNYKLVPGYPLAYWASNELLEVFSKGKPLGEIVDPRQGLATTDNKKFLRLWFELDYGSITYDCYTIDQVKEFSKLKWVPYNKGGYRRQWYGNYDYVVNWSNNGQEIKDNVMLKYSYLKNPDFVVKNTSYYFKPAITWNLITTGSFSIRFRDSGSIHDVSGMSAFSKNNEDLFYLLGLLSTKISDKVFGILNPTLNLQVGDFNNFPVLLDKEKYDFIIEKSKANIDISKFDWDMFEVSWDYKKTPLMDQNQTNIKDAYQSLKTKVNRNFNLLKENEMILNDIFISMYNLKNELNIYVSDRNITVTKIFDDKSDIDEEIKGNRYIETKEDVIKDFISYAVGCMMGRYSLDEEGLIYAGGEFDYDRYVKFKPQKDNVLIISEDGSFKGDIVDKFEDFLKVSFSESSLEDNLSFIADALGGAGSSRERIRKYFVNNFYQDHVKRYQKTPIYWLYDSSAGKTVRQSANGFKALIYMHRYNENTTGKVRIDYLHTVQRGYENELNFIDNALLGNPNPKEEKEFNERKVTLNKKMKEIQDYDELLSHMALERISIDLDDGVKVNHQKIQTDDKGDTFKILRDIK